MSDIYVEYDNGEWAVWSTVIDDWVATGLTEHELVVRAGQRASERAKRDAREAIEAVKDDDGCYAEDQPPDEEIEALRERKRGSGDSS